MTQAQKVSEYRDYFRLKNNVSFYGKLISYNIDTIELETIGGSRVKFLQSQVAKVRMSQKGDLGPIPLKISRNLFETNQKTFIELNSNLFAGHGEFLVNGLGLNVHLKHNLYRNHFISLSTGYNTFSTVGIINIIPVSLGYEYYFLREKNAPFVYARGGIGFSDFIDENQVWFERTYEAYHGGRMEFGGGILISLSEHLGLVLSTGLVIQKTGYSITDPWGSVERDIILRRLTFNFGFVF